MVSQVHAALTATAVVATTILAAVKETFAAPITITIEWMYGHRYAHDHVLDRPHVVNPLSHFHLLCYRADPYHMFRHRPQHLLHHLLLPRHQSKRYRHK
jgi:hypothetical protein